MYLFVRSEFGSLSVMDDIDNSCRRLLFGRQIQGGSWHQPAAKEVVPDLDGPGPIPCAAYQLGWLAAGVDVQVGSVLMLGLGAGSGIVALLAEFPSIDVTVAEIDPAVIQAARTAFPLLVHYERAGRLNIVQQCAWSFMRENEDTWAAILIDLYRGKDFGLHDAELLMRAADRTAKIWCNHIGTLDTLSEAMICIEDKQPMTYVFCSSESQHWSGRPQNLIATTSKLSITNVAAYVPFETFQETQPAARWAADEYRRLLVSALVPTHVD